MLTMPGIVATAEITIAAPATTVPAALTDPRQIKEYLFGSTVETDCSRAARSSGLGSTHAAQKWQTMLAGLKRRIDGH
jgi:uncharacterized protein YndB with AHSA1/START domain